MIGASDSAWGIQPWEAVLAGVLPLVAVYLCPPLFRLVDRIVGPVWDVIVAPVHAVVAWFRLTPGQRRRWWNGRRSERTLAQRMRTW